MGLMTMWYIWMFPKIVGFPPKSSILREFSIINHPFWGTPSVGNTHMYNIGIQSPENGNGTS